jgi:hypothetical protein
MKWNDYFKIECVENPAMQDITASNWMLEDYYKYELRDPDGNLIGSYKDFRYAKKQAEYKFKKMMAKLEKILLA